MYISFTVCIVVLTLNGKYYFFCIECVLIYIVIRKGCQVVVVRETKTGDAERACWMQVYWPAAEAAGL